MGTKNKKHTTTQSLTILLEGALLDTEKLEEIEAMLGKFGTVLDVQYENLSEKERQHIAELSTHLGKGKEDASDSSDYSYVIEQIQDEAFLKNLDEIAEKLGSSNPLQVPIKEIKKRFPTGRLGELSGQEISQLSSKLRRARTLVQKKKFLLDQILTFLVPLPEGEEYKHLRLTQQMVRTHLDFPTLLQNPNLIEGALQTAFLEYKKLYIDRYIEELSTYEETLEHMYSLQEKLSATITATQILDQIPELGPPTSQVLQDEFYALFGEYVRIPFEETDLRIHLSSHPFYQKFSLGTRAPVGDFQTLERKIQKTLEQKLQKIQSSTITKVMAKGSGDDLEKLMNLLQLSHMEEIVELLNTDRSSEIITALRKLLH